MHFLLFVRLRDTANSVPCECTMSLTKTTRWREYDVHFNAFSCYSVDSLFPCRLLLLLCFDSIVLVCLFQATVSQANCCECTVKKCHCAVHEWPFGRQWATSNMQMKTNVFVCIPRLWWFCLMEFTVPPMGISSSSLTPSKPEIDRCSWRSLWLGCLIAPDLS